MEGFSPAECAQREALEEAGVKGKIAASPLGFYTYQKVRKTGRSVPCRVHVFALKVTKQRARWPERKVREFIWCAPRQCMERVKEIGLRRLIRKFAAAPSQRKRG